MSKSRDDSVKPGCGINGNEGVGWQTKNVSVEAMKAMYGSGKDVVIKHNTKDISG